MTKRTILCGMLTTACLWAASGCGDSTVVAPGVTATENGETLTINSPTSELRASTGDGSIDLPKDFPKDVPIYPEATVKMVNQMPAGNMLMVGFETPAATGEVWKFYEKQLESAGWEFNLKTKVEKGGHLAAKKGNRHCTITLGERKKTGHTTASLMLQTRPEKQ